MLGGLIHYAIENNRIAKDYLLNYTNAAFIVKDGFKLPEDGVFSGFDAAKQSTTVSTWNYSAAPPTGGPQAKNAGYAVMLRLRQGDLLTSACCRPCRKKSTSTSLAESSLCLSVANKHYSRYTPEMVRDNRHSRRPVF